MEKIMDKLTMSTAALIIDAEIIRAIQGKNEPRLPGIDYCDGWHDFPGMGISTVCAYDCLEGRYRVFCGDNKADLANLIAARRWVVGFNSNAFDLPLLAACWHITVPEDKSYDLLAEIWQAAGLGPIHQSPGHNGYSLDACCHANLQGVSKSGHGALAPVLWQRGRTATVIDYCLQDVNILSQLLRAMRVRSVDCYKNFHSPVTGAWLNVPLPSPRPAVYEVA